MILISDLTAAGIIAEQDAITLKATLNKQKDLLRALYFYFESKVFTRPSNTGFMLILDPYKGYDLDDLKQDQTSYLKLLAILYRHQLIIESVYRKLSLFPLEGNNNGYFAALYMATELSSFYKHFTLEKQLEFVELLSGRSEFGRDGILDYRKKARLTKDVKDGKLDTYLDFFKYSYCCDFLNINTYQGKPKQLLKKLVKIFNSLTYQNAFAIQDISIDEEDFFGEPSYDNRKATIIIDTGSRKHQHTYTFSVDKDHSPINILLVLRNVLVHLNNLLADYACNFRFTSITNDLNKSLFPTGSELCAICRADQINEHIFDFRSMQSKFLFNHPSLLSYSSPLSYTHIQYAIYHFLECGLLLHLTEEQLNNIKNKLFEGTYEHTGDLMAIFPGTIAIVHQNITNGQKPYSAFLEALNTISHGILKFTAIKDGLPDEFDYETESEFKVSFICNGLAHEVVCRLNFKNFDQGLIYYIINEIIRKECLNYQLINIVGGVHDQDYFLFASDQQVDYLKSKKLLIDIPRF